MAYTDLQKRDIARELARNGGNVAAAQRALRDEYEFFRTIGISTIRRVMAEDGFSELIGDEHAKIAEAREEQARARERQIAKDIYSNTILERLRRDESLLDDARSRLETLLKDPDKVDVKTAIFAFDVLAKVQNQRANRLAPAVAETDEAIHLVESVQEEIVAQFGPQKSQAVIKGIRERYEKKKSASRAMSQSPQTSTVEQ